MKRIVLTCTLAAIILGLAAVAAAETKIGVLAKRGAPKCMQKWGATAAYLSEQIGTDVKIVPLKFEAIEPAVAAGRVDYVLANSAFYVGLEKSHGVHAVATLINSRKGQALSKFGGVILVKQGSPVQTIADLKGKKFMAVKKSSFGGAHMAWRLMLENGVDPQVDCAEFVFGNKHDNVVLAVLNGAVDAGTVRSDTVERMADEGKIELADLRVVNPVEDDFPFVHSTRLYPEWPLAACVGADPAVTGTIVAALKGLTPDHVAAKAAKIAGWSDPADYGEVVACLTAIQYGAFASVQ
ncbi:MAG: phosphate/phosphite/phosphonate ABC transporter substrate-binding protein [bacterium]|nr:phosphate/phosphite/phosphonate ABC transporter substrate-binding protein [bacterium]